VFFFFISNKDLFISTKETSKYTREYTEIYNQLQKLYKSRIEKKDCFLNVEGVFHPTISLSLPSSDKNPLVPDINDLGYTLTSREA